ncbi:hypothetical protein HZS_5406 [Henneguya salminicola]|nr:hypothetical protein HZS_5406 [Henneguya salminicola]
MSFTVVTTDNVYSVLTSNTIPVVLGVFCGTPYPDYVYNLPASSILTFAAADSTAVALPEDFTYTTLPAFFFIPVGKSPLAYNGSTDLRDWIKSFWA